MEEAPGTVIPAISELRRFCLMCGASHLPEAAGLKCPPLSTSLK